jgi:hypothetical protein
MTDRRESDAARAFVGLQEKNSRIVALDARLAPLRLIILAVEFYSLNASPCTSVSRLDE